MEHKHVGEALDHQAVEGRALEAVPFQLILLARGIDEGLLLHDRQLLGLLLERRVEVV